MLTRFVRSGKGPFKGPGPGEVPLCIRLPSLSLAGTLVNVESVAFPMLLRNVSSQGPGSFSGGETSEAELKS